MMPSIVLLLPIAASAQSAQQVTQLTNLKECQQVVGLPAVQELDQKTTAYLAAQSDLEAKLTAFNAACTALAGSTQQNGTNAQTGPLVTQFNAAASGVSTSYKTYTQDVSAMQNSASATISSLKSGGEKACLASVYKLINAGSDNESAMTRQYHGCANAPSSLLGTGVTGNGGFSPMQSLQYKYVPAALQPNSIPLHLNRPRM